MRRDPGNLTGRTFDVLVVGGGIYGACVAWDAVLRGLSVALVDRGDFGAATSSNSLKIAHGGLRYLQQADIPRMRQSIRERRTLMRVAPHLVHPMRCVLPTYGHGMKGREALTMAMWANDVVGFDRNRIGDPQKHLPRGRMLSPADCLDLIPGLDGRGLTGAACWHDCQIYNPDRLVLAFVSAAARHGAEVANYVEVTGFLAEGGRVAGVRATDRLDGESFDIRARTVANCAGPWVGHVAGLGGPGRAPVTAWSWAMNVVTRKLDPEVAFGVYARHAFRDGIPVRREGGAQTLFIVPWRGVTLIGTTHRSYHGTADGFRLTEARVRDFIAEVDRAYPAACLTMRDVRYWYGGLLPMRRETPAGEVDLLKSFRVLDHGSEGRDGLVSVLGVKFTTARHVAGKVVDVLFRKLGRRSPPARSASEPVTGGDIGEFARFEDDAVAHHDKIDPALLRPLLRNHGTEFTRVLALADDGAEGTGKPLGPDNLLLAAVRHAVREEMAVKLSDVVRRRTELGSAGRPAKPDLELCASEMARELRWPTEKTAAEIAEVEAMYRLAP